MKLNVILFLSFFQLFLITANILTDTALVVADGTRQSITNRAAEVKSSCQGDYSPCECSTYGEEPAIIEVHCPSNIESFAIIQEVFQRSTTARQITSFSLEIPNSEINKTLPSDLLNATTTRDIHLFCPNPLNQLISLDPNTFRASKNYAQFLNISNCDLGRLDFIFLKDFSTMKELYFSTNINLSSSLASLPYLQNVFRISVTNSIDFEGFGQYPTLSLPSWSQLSVTWCPNFQYLTKPGTLPPIRTLEIGYCPLFKQWDVVTQLNQLHYITLMGLNEETINNALNALSSSSLVDQIITLNLYRNGLKQIPGQLRHFSQLQYVLLPSNELSTANNGSLTFTTHQLDILDLSFNQLNHLEPDAFQGNFSNSRIMLTYNNISRLESSVFKSILVQMEAVNRSGGVYIELNPIECDCHLAWLFRDNPNLVDRVIRGTCSTGNPFSNLNAEFFASCPEETTVIPLTTESMTGGVNSIQPFNRSNLFIVVGFLFFLQV